MRILHFSCWTIYSFRDDWKSPVESIRIMTGHPLTPNFIRASYFDLAYKEKGEDRPHSQSMNGWDWGM